MLITCTDKAINECAKTTLQRRGIPPEQVEPFLAGESIEVPDEVGQFLISNELATEGGA